MLRRPRIEAQAARNAAAKVVEMALAGQADEAVGEDLTIRHGTGIGADRGVWGRPSHGPTGNVSKGSPGAFSPTPDPGPGAGRHTELGRDSDHDVDLFVGDVGRLHWIAVRRFDHGAIALDRRYRLHPEAMRLAVDGEHATIEAGEQPERRQLPRQPLALLPGLLAKAGRARGSLGGGSRLGIVQAALAGIAAQPHDIAGQGFSATHGLSLSA
jgi:hypothetical protein